MRTMLLGLWFQFLATTLSEGTINNNQVTWENATKLCNLSVVGAADVKDHSGSGFWQPFVQIKTNQITTKGCHMLETLKIEASRLIENNNVTTCYHFCKFDYPQMSSKIKAFIIKGDNCSCVNKYDENETACPNSCAQNDTTGNSEQGNNVNTYTVYEIGNTILKTEYNAGCGSTRPGGDLTFDDCNTKRGGYFSNVHGNKLIIENFNITWAEFNRKCDGHLASFNEAQSIKRTSSSNIRPSVRFWVGECIWSYVHFGFDFDLLSNRSENTSIKCGYYNKAAGKNEFGTCSSKHFYKCSNTDMMSKNTESSIGTNSDKNQHDDRVSKNTESSIGTNSDKNQHDNRVSKNTESSIHTNSDKNQHDMTNHGEFIGIIVGLIAILVILLASIYIYIKRRKERNRNICTDQVNGFRDRNLIYDEMCLENDYDHLHDSTDEFHDTSNVNVYDVSRPIGGGNTIRGGDVYNTTKLNDTYDSSTQATLMNPNKGALNDDTYNSMQGPNRGIHLDDANLSLTTTDSAPRNDKTSDSVYHEISSF